MKKNKFKKLVMTNIHEVAKKYLSELKEKHSKSTGLTHCNMIAGYLSTNQLSTEEKQLLFKFRTRTFNCRANYKSQYGSELACQICQNEDDQPHILLCNKTIEGINLGNVQYEHIFGTTAQQIKITKILKLITNKRMLLLKKSSIPGSQAHQS